MEAKFEATVYTVYKKTPTQILLFSLLTEPFCKLLFSNYFAVRKLIRLARKLVRLAHFLFEESRSKCFGKTALVQIFISIRCRILCPVWPFSRRAHPTTTSLYEVPPPVCLFIRKRFIFLAPSEVQLQHSARIIYDVDTIHQNMRNGREMNDCVH